MDDMVTPVSLDELTPQQRSSVEHAISETLDKIAGAWATLRTEQHRFESAIKRLTELTPNPVDALRYQRSAHFMDKATREAIIEASGLLDSTNT